MSLGEEKQSVLSAVATFLGLVDRDLGLPLSRTLLQAALHPGLSINDLAEQLGVPQQTASRYVAVLQGRYELPSVSSSVSARTPLLTLEISQHDPRRRAIFLTPEGEKRIEKLLSEYPRNHEQHSRIGQTGRSRAAERMESD
jgi:DNA-binding MarR family transcriptional regulator